MAILTVGLDARQLVLGRFLGPGTSHHAIGVIDPTKNGFSCKMRIAAPAKMLDQIRDDFHKAYGVTMELEPFDHDWGAHFNFPAQSGMNSLSLVRALDGIQNHLLRCYGSIQGGHMTIRLETDLTALQLQRFAANLRQYGTREHVEISALISESLELSSRWAPFLRQLTTA